jgi:4-amino-4-deoxy-L-arabinose transferase-like glycosyltransferase
MALVVLCAAFAVRCGWIATHDAITSDETTHLVHCLNYWMTGDDLGMWRLGAPRLPHAANALASYLALRPAGLLPWGVSDDEERVTRLTRLVLSGADRVLVPARMVAIGSGLALLVLVYWSVARLRGPVAGLVAAGLLSAVPEVVAHSAIAGSDMPFTASAFLALILAARYAERPSPGRWAALALGIGLAWAMRHTALLLLPLAGGLHLAVQWDRERPSTAWAMFERLILSVWATIGLASLAFLVLWAGDGLQLVTLGEVGQKVTMVKVPQKVGSVGLSAVPLPSSALSILKQVRHQGQGHIAYFLGQSSTTGWPLYFPIAFLLKTPLGLILLGVLTIARVRPRYAWDAIVLAFLAILWITLVRNKVNIGLRYALLTYPILVAFAARLFEPAMLRDRVWGLVTLGAAGALLVASAGAGSRCLSYFNSIGGGARDGWVYLADSNIDWGQDFDRLKQAIARNRIREVTFDLHSERLLDLPGVFSVAYPARTLQVPDVTPPNRRLYDAEGGYLPVYTRYMAVSATRLLGLYSQNDVSYLRTRRLVERVGDSIFLFDLDQPAERPFYQ